MHADAPVGTGTTVTFSKTISEAEVYLFAGITGDFSPNHTNEQYMKDTRFGQRVVHGALTLGYVSTCSTKLIELLDGRPAVNYGYDRIRFVKPVFFGDTITVTYVVDSFDEERQEIRATATVTKQDGAVVAVAANILRLI